MPVYIYTAMDQGGQTSTGELESPSLQAAADLLHGRGMHILKLHEGNRWQGLWPSKLLRQQKGRRKYAMLFCRQLALMLAAGLPLDTCLRILAENGSDKAYRTLLADLSQCVKGGLPLSQAMQKHTAVFSPPLIKLVAAGDASGSLDKIMLRLAGQLEKSYAAREKMKSAMMYPLLLLVASIVAVTLLTALVLPTFATLFANLQADLPLPTRAILAASDWLRQDFWWLLLGSAALLAVATYLYRREPIRCRIDYLLLRWPFWGRMQQENCWQQILGTLAVLLESGIVIDQALAMTREVTGNHYLSRLLTEATASVRRGNKLTVAIEASDVLPPVVLELLLAGEASGALDFMLQKAADLCELEAQNKLARIQALAEPTMIIVLGGIVFFFVLSIALPLLDTLVLL